MPRLTLRWALTVLLLLPASLLASELFNEAGYRLTLYRSPTPLNHEQATTLDPQQLHELLQQEPNAALLDVYGNPWLRGHFTLQEDHRNLPGSLWLANCGTGELAPGWEPYCAGWLEHISGGDKNFPLVFYCRIDCWLGWNAAKRAADWGYQRLYWLRDGIEGWAEAGFELVPSQPADWPQGVTAPEY